MLTFVPCVSRATVSATSVIASRQSPGSHWPRLHARHASHCEGRNESEYPSHFSTASVHFESYTLPQIKSTTVPWNQRSLDRSLGLPSIVHPSCPTRPLLVPFLRFARLQNYFALGSRSNSLTNVRCGRPAPGRSLAASRAQLPLPAPKHNNASQRYVRFIHPHAERQLRCLQHQCHGPQYN
jgi:hypothetical protein